MTRNSIYIGQTALQSSSEKVEGTFVKLEGEDFYQIRHYDQMRPFFMSVVSHSDHWLYISSKGGLSAGRKNPENALFPYYTDDKIHDSGELTGSKSILLVEREEKTFLWEPFSDRYQGLYQITRNLYKNTFGNKLIFEEINHDLEMVFSYGWFFSQQYGFVKRSRLINQAEKEVKVSLLDGVQNLLPYGVDLRMQTETSTLLDAYKKNELLTPSGLGLFLLSAIPVDKAEPSEALKATTVWSTGIEVEHHLLSSIQVEPFRQGLPLETETDVRAERGAFFIQSILTLPAGEQKTWYFVAEINQGPSQVAALDNWLQQKERLIPSLKRDIEAGVQHLASIIARADGLQKSADRMMTARHFANVLFNVMRGGIFHDHYFLQKKDLLRFFGDFNKKVLQQQEELLNSLPDKIYYPELLEMAADSGDTHFHRLCLEYLPLTFSRRHGDPSRPWNKFSIELQDERGEKKMYYEGNWRDIFQNWEALALSYPRFIESMISKFVNASTSDGYNPYRITRNGIDWEVSDPEDPWSYIGYWGDHQIIYLLKLLELSKKHHPGDLEQLLSKQLFSYANVPYRIKDYQALLADPQDTILFDMEEEEEIMQRVEKLGADGKLVLDEDGKVLHVNLAEKLLVPLLAKLSNFIPEGGIWLNTQRPEWNDANNALVGYGISMVTLCYIRRFVSFCQSLFSGLDSNEISVSVEVAEMFHSISDTFSRYQKHLDAPISNTLRRQIVDELGNAGTAYRTKVYGGFSQKSTAISLKELDTFFQQTLAFADHSIHANRRSDALYHSYNLLTIEENGDLSIRYLYEMLEGQVAVLSSGLLSAEETLEVLKALRNSKLYRADQHSYILYPNRQLARFDVKNNIPESVLEQSSLLTQMVQNGDTRLIEKDIKGQYHFNGNFHNQKDLEAALGEIGGEEYAGLVNREQKQILSIFEQVFDHQSFTGRSGTFFAYEGLGSIYWHMVSKLLLAVQENCWSAINQNLDSGLLEQLISHYYDIRQGIGFNKTPEEYGAFPSDPYSHTPGNAGAQQPGMTGQVKEDMIARYGELGVFIQDGKITFHPRILSSSEFLSKPTVFNYYNLNGAKEEINLAAGTLAFTYCQVPIIYHEVSDQFHIKVYQADGEKIELPSLEISQTLTDEILNRSGKITQIEVFLKPGLNS